VASEVTYTLDPNGTDPIVGVKGIDLYEKKVTGTNSKIAEPGDKISYGSTYPLVFDTKKQVYQKELVMCATSDAQTQQQANRTQVETSATRTLDGVKAGPLTFELRTCSLDADDALGKSYSKGNGVWYATVDWDEPVSSKTLQQVVEEAARGDKVPDAFFSYQGQGILASDNPVYQEKFKGKQANALGAFALGCVAACGACHGVAAIVTLGTTLPAAAIDCAISCGAGTAMGGYELYKDDADGIPVLEEARDITEVVYGIPRDLATIGLDQGAENEGANSALFATEVASTIKALKSPVSVKKLAYVDPKEAIEAADLLFLSETDAAISSKVIDNAKIADEYLSKWTEKQLVRGQPKVPVPPIAPVRAQYQNRVQLFDLEKKKITDGFAKLKAKHASNPNFKVADFDALEQKVVTQLDALQVEFGDTPAGLRYKIANGQPTNLRLNTIETTANTGKTAVTETAGKAKKVKVPEKATQTKSFKKTTGFVRGLVCGGIGGVAGYSLYRETLTEEVENKISLDAGSSNVIDSTTSNLIFQKGQTYQFTVGPGPGAGKSNTLTIDIVDPTTLVPINAWLDDCAQK
jgi:hypothetical protein